MHIHFSVAIQSAGGYAHTSFVVEFDMEWKATRVKTLVYLLNNEINPLGTFL